MGKGDRKSKKGKRFMGSFGNSRKRKKKARKFVVQKKAAAAPVAAPEAVIPQVTEQVETIAAAPAKPKIKRATTAKKKDPKAPKKAAKKAGEGEAAAEK